MTSTSVWLVTCLLNLPNCELPSSFSQDFHLTQHLPGPYLKRRPQARHRDVPTLNSASSYVPKGNYVTTECGKHGEISS